MSERLKYFIYSVLLLCPFNGYCQPDIKDSTEAYNYWVQRGITELIYSSMQDNPNKLTVTEQKGKEEFHEKFINGIDKKSLSEIEQAFREIDQFLTNNSYERTSINFFLPLKSAYEQKKPFNDQFFKVPHNYENPQNWDKKKNQLLDGYNNSLKVKVRVIKPTTKLEIVQETLPDKPQKKVIISGWIWAVSGLLLGFFSGAFLIYQYSGSRIYSILKTEKRKYLSDLRKDRSQNLILRNYFKYIGIVSMLKNSKDKKAEALENQKEEIMQLGFQNEKLRTEIEKNGSIIANLKNAAEYQASAREDPDGRPRKSSVIPDKMEIFFTIPEMDGSFRIVNAKDGQSSDCFYKIEPDNSGQKGKLYFISGDFDLRALDNIDYYLNPVCEIQNISDRIHARNIEMTNPGLVIRRGEVWKIEENNKVKIKLV